MKKKVYLHIGTHKTGTTSFQQLIRKNSDALQGQGIYVPPVGLLQSTRGEFNMHGGGLHHICSALKGKTSFDVVEAYLEAFESSDCPFACISSEGFDNLGNLALDKFEKAFSSYDISIILVLRHPLSLAKSFFCSRGGVRNFNNSSFLIRALRMQRFNYSNLIDIYSKVGSVAVIKYEECNNVSDALLSFMGVNQANLFGIESRIRQSLLPHVAIANQQIYSGLGVKEKIYLQTLYPHLVAYADLIEEHAPDFYTKQKKLMPFPEEAQVAFMNQWSKMVFDADCPIMQEARWSDWRECSPMGRGVDETMVSEFKEGFMNWLFSVKLGKKQVVL